MDQKNIYFMAETVDTLTPPEDGTWMNLWFTLPEPTKDIIAWYGITYRVCFKDGKPMLHEYDAEKGWHPTHKVKYSIQNRQVIYTIPLKLLGQANNPQKLNLRFKWSDNMQDTTKPIDWIVNGDAAPNGRGMYQLTFEK